jgi:RNA polymerase sigma factor (TIGR02999 family)
VSSEEGDPEAFAREGARKSAGELVAELYPELRRIAGSLLGARAAGATLQPTAIVNEAYLRLNEQRAADWESRAHFLAIAARCMRRVLVDHVRSRAAAKRPASERRVTLAGELAADEALLELDLFELDRALERLGAVKEPVF